MPRLTPRGDFCEKQTSKESRGEFQGLFPVFFERKGERVTSSKKIRINHTQYHFRIVFLQLHIPNYLFFFTTNTNTNMPFAARSGGKSNLHKILHHLSLPTFPSRANPAHQRRPSRRVHKTHFYYTKASCNSMCCIVISIIELQAKL